MFAPIREIFAACRKPARARLRAGRFSFNVKGGRCEACQGDGVIKVEMHFLADVYVPCDVCKGKRYNRETLEIRFKGKNIQEVLEMTVEEALPFFAAVPTVQPKLQTLLDVGLSYVRLGQSATTLSGGEAQRVKLAKELSKRATGRTLYILDEPTTGLHFADIAQLLTVLHRLRDEGNTVIVIEHNLDVIKTADWVVDLGGPEGGDGGGAIGPRSRTGTPDIMIAAHTASRALVVTAIAIQTPAPHGREAARPHVSVGELCFALLTGFLPATLLGTAGLIGLAAAIVIRIAFVPYVKKYLGGYAADYLGATQQLTEVGFYLGALAAWTYF
jgi:excinuclease UvrABC ATPase subunit